MPSMQDVEEKISSYFTYNHGQHPRYLLMDEFTYKEFNKKFQSIIKYNALEQEDTNMKTFYSSLDGIILQVLEVKSDHMIFDVVGG